MFPTGPLPAKSAWLISTPSPIKTPARWGRSGCAIRPLSSLSISQFFQGRQWDDQQIRLALTQIISRAVYPGSELRTSRWIKENSAICEITGYPAEKVTKDKLYKSALDLYDVKDALEQFLSKRTNELFDLQDRIILYDLTNTYFEGARRSSKLAQHAKNKSKEEKRDDARLIVLALVVNMEGFIKFSSVFEGKKKRQRVPWRYCGQNPRLHQ